MNFSTWFDNNVKQFEFKDGVIISSKDLTLRALDVINRGTDGIDFITGKRGYNNNIYGYGGNDVLTGMGYADAIYGGYGDDILTSKASVYYVSNSVTYDGGRGNDTILCSGGKETILFNYGDGNDLINSASYSDEIVFGAGINYSDFSYSKTSNGNLKINIGSDSLSFDSLSINMGKFKFANGTYVTYQDVNAAAYAVFNPPKVVEEPKPSAAMMGGLMLGAGSLSQLASTDSKALLTGTASNLALPDPQSVTADQSISLDVNKRVDSQYDYLAQAMAEGEDDGDSLASFDQSANLSLLTAIHYE